MENVVSLFPQPVEIESKTETVAKINHPYRDVTKDPVIYAKPKPFVFPTRSQLNWITSNRQARQMVKEQNGILLYEMTTCPSYLINNTKSVKVTLCDDNLWSVVIHIIQSAFSGERIL